ncbi:MAG: XisI protein [Microcystis novacekii Mn_MB_F_20050700_S1]|uniref:XisI protein n=1 Tax=Microcystis novacekii Mn_MB_F_20050700_S1D TaxID=2486266 RepID=A0A552JBG3_9CHRO|nr:MAG: XisI protein [Microcystis novacekii Mn_MB_F_20050700_S1]TRU92864.1 MAG: XisI protein [Microcystis novacekii Mn_MB_F_20050700_S1D]
MIKKILTKYAEISSQVPDQDIEEILIFDDDRSQYLWFNIGWKNGNRIKAISVYLLLKNDKIYIEEDWTEAGIATELMRVGIPSSEIVLPFQPPEVRQFTEFAIA